MAELGGLKGLGGRRGPLKPPWSFRWTLVLLFFVVIPLAAAFAATILSWRNEPSLQDFLYRWLSLMPFMWGVMGPIQGMRLAAAIGYPIDQMIGRLFELAIVATAFAGCALALGLMFPADPRAMFGPVFGAIIYAAFAVVEFFRRLVAR